MNKKIFLVLTVIAASCMQTMACTNFLIGKKASKDGSTMISYSADSYGMFGELYHFPAGMHEKGTMRDIYEWDTGKYLGKIKEADQTYNVIGNMNEFQVAIGETTFGGRHELMDPTGILDYGSLIYVTLQRSRTAKEAIKVMTELVKEYGYYSSGESFSIADPNEVWILEMIGKGPGVKGAVWVAVRIPDDCIASHANQSRIHTFNMNDKENCLYAPDVISFAREKGYFEGANKDFSFADAYCPLDFGGLRACEARVWSFYNQFNKEVGKEYLPTILGESNKPLPLYIKPDHKLSVRDVQKAMRDHYEGTPLDMTVDPSAGPFNTPYRMGGLGFKVGDTDYFNERPISTQQSAFAFVAQLRSEMPDAVGGVLWFGTDDANFISFCPIYCCTDRIPACYSHEEADCVTFSWNSAFWVYNWVAEMVRPKYSLVIDDVRKVQNMLEDTFEQAQEGIEKAALAMYEKDPAQAKAFLTNYSCLQSESAIATWKKLGEYLIVKYNDGVMKRTNADGSIMKPKMGNNAPLTRPAYPKEFLEEVVKATGDRYKKPVK